MYDDRLKLTMNKVDTYNVSACAADLDFWNKVK